MTIREWLIKTIGIRENIPQSTVLKIIQHNYESANKALRKHNSIEISGFGKFYYNTKKAHKQMEKCLSQKIAFQEVLDKPSITDKERHSYEQRMKTVDDNIKALEEKMLEEI